MKRIFNVIAVICILLSLNIEYLYAQADWNYGSNLISSESGVNIGIGTTIMNNSRLRLDLGSYTENSGGLTGMFITSNPLSSYAKGTVSLKLSQNSSWYDQGILLGVNGYVTINSTSSRSKESYCGGGRFTANLSNYSNTGGYTAYVNGVSSVLKGTIAAYPAKSIISALLAVDDINNVKTWAGYFQGKGYFSGNVGIGILEPNAMLDVAGDIRAEEIQVTLASMEDLHLNGTLAANNITYTANGNTADHVFEENYNLRSLEEIETFIKENKHLPDVPSAAAMEEKGVNLAEMNKLLLQKVEELTLYTISQEQRLAEKDKEISLLKKEVEERLLKLEDIISSINTSK